MVTTTQGTRGKKKKKKKKSGKGFQVLMRARHDIADTRGSVVLMSGQEPEKPRGLDVETVTTAVMTSGNMEGNNGVGY